MTDQSIARLLNDPAVRELFAMRRRRYVVLSAIVCVVYGAVAMACAFAPDFLRRPLLPGTSISIGIASMVLVIIVAFVLSGYYTWWSNTVRDPLVERLKAGRAR